MKRSSSNLSLRKTALVISVLPIVLFALHVILPDDGGRKLISHVWFRSFESSFESLGI